jgi:hypothetical protein
MLIIISVLITILFSIDILLRIQTVSRSKHRFFLIKQHTILLTLTEKMNFTFSFVIGENPTKTQLSAIAESCVRKSCYPNQQPALRFFWKKITRPDNSSARSSVKLILTE